MNESRVVWAEAELELSNARYAKLMAWQEAEKKGMVELEKAMEELNLENSVCNPIRHLWRTTSSHRRRTCSSC